MPYAISTDKGDFMRNLYAAVAKKDLKAVRRAFEADSSQASGALENAAENGALKIVAYLTEQGVRHDWAIVNAARFDHVRTVAYLGKRRLGNMQAALIAAVAHGCEKSARWLVKNVEGLDLTEALADAVFKRHEKIALFLLEQGADPFERKNGGVCAFERAKERGLDAFVQACAFKK